MTTIEQFDTGQILDHQWGYEQTNHDFYQVIKRSGEWVVIAKMTDEETSDGPLTMTGRVQPLAIDPKAEPMRRKICRWTDGRILGVKINRYTAAAEPWTGQPERVSHYA
jgi:hypothetical protein